MENESGYPGKLVRFNNDDDNSNLVADYLENEDYDYPGGGSWVAFTDDDLVQVILDRGFSDLSGMDGFVFELKVTASTGYGLSYWADAEKTRMVNGTNDGEPVQIYEGGKWKDVYTWEVSNGEVDYPSSIHVEGINADALTDTLMWHLFDPSDELVDVDTVKMTDPTVTLRIDNDNNGYINSSKNPDREQAEIKLQKEGVGKPITYWGPDPNSPFGAINHESEFVPMELIISGGKGSGLWWHVKVPQTLAVFRVQGTTFVPFDAAAKQLDGDVSLKLYVKAAGTSDTTQNIEVDLYRDVQLVNKVEGFGAKASFVIQDNSSHLTKWIIPNEWTIRGETVKTPMPVEKAEGPQREWTGKDYNKYNKGDAYTRDAIEGAFTLTFDVKLDDRFIQPDTNGNEFTPDGDARKLSFVANSGVKIGPKGSDPASDLRKEVAIIDIKRLIDRVGGIEAFNRKSIWKEIHKVNFIDDRDPKKVVTYLTEELTSSCPLSPTGERGLRVTAPVGVRVCSDRAGGHDGGDAQSRTGAVETRGETPESGLRRPHAIRVRARGTGENGPLRSSLKTVRLAPATKN